jgi:hypothetical protein
MKLVVRLFQEEVHTLFNIVWWDNSLERDAEDHRFDFGHEDVRHFFFLDLADRLAMLEQDPLPFATDDADFPTPWS